MKWRSLQGVGRRLVLLIRSIALTLGLVILANTSTMEFEQTKKMENSIHGTEDVGYGMVLVDDQGQPLRTNTLELKEGDHFRKVLNFINKSGRDSRFALMVFVDYVQTAFSTSASPHFQLTHQFDLANQHAIELPIQLAADAVPPGVHDVLLYVVAGADRHSATLGRSTFSYGMELRLQVRKGAEARALEVLPPVQHQAVPIEEPFAGLLLNDNRSAQPQLKVPSLLWEVSPHQEVDLGMYFGGYPVNRYLMMVTVGFRQVADVEGQRHVHVALPSQAVGFRSLRIRAPEARGDYEVIGLLVLNPWETPDRSRYLEFKTDTSYRFTLRVR